MDAGRLFLFLSAIISASCEQAVTINAPLAASEMQKQAVEQELEKENSTLVDLESLSDLDFQFEKGSLGDINMNGINDWLIENEAVVERIDVTDLPKYLDDEYDLDELHVDEDLRNFHNRHYMAGKAFQDTIDEVEGLPAVYRRAYYKTIISSTIENCKQHYEEYVDGRLVQFTPHYIASLDDETERKEAESRVQHWQLNMGVRFAYVLKQRGHIVAYVLVSHARGDMNTRILDVLSNEEVPRSTNLLLLWILSMELNSRHALFLKKLKIQAVHGGMVSYFERFGFKALSFIPDKDITIEGDFWETSIYPIEMVATRDDVIKIDSEHMEKLLKTESRKDHTGKYAGGYLGSHYGSYDRGFKAGGGGESGGEAAEGEAAAES